MTGQSPDCPPLQPRRCRGLAVLVAAAFTVALSTPALADRTDRRLIAATTAAAGALSDLAASLDQAAAAATRASGAVMDPARSRDEAAAAVTGLAGQLAAEQGKPTGGAGDVPTAIDGLQAMVAARSRMMDVARAVAEAIGKQNRKAVEKMGRDASLEALIGAAGRLAKADVANQIRAAQAALDTLRKEATKRAAGAMAAEWLVLATKLAPGTKASSGAGGSLAPSIMDALLVAFMTSAGAANDDLRGLIEDQAASMRAQGAVRETMTKLETVKRAGAPLAGTDGRRAALAAALHTLQRTGSAMALLPVEAASGTGKAGRSTMGEMDPMALLMFVLLESYRQTKEDLRHHAEKVKQLNEQKARLREALATLRTARDALHLAAARADLAVRGATLDLAVAAVGRQPATGNEASDLWAAMMAYARAVNREAREDKKAAKAAKASTAAAATKARLPPTPEEAERARQRSAVKERLRQLNARGKSLRREIAELQSEIAGLEVACRDATERAAREASTAARAAAGAAIGFAIGGPLGAAVGAAVGAASSPAPAVAAPEECRRLLELMALLEALQAELAGIQREIKQAMAELARMYEVERRRQERLERKAVSRTPGLTKAITSTTGSGGIVSHTKRTRAIVGRDLPCGTAANPCKKVKAPFAGGLLEGGGGFASQGPSAIGGGGSTISRGGGGVSVDYGGCAYCGAGSGNAVK